MATITQTTKGRTGTGTNKSLLIVAGVVAGLLIIGALVAAVLLNGSGSGSRQPTTVTVLEPAANSTVALHVGDTLAVTLDGNPTTGYTWEVASTDTSILRQVGQAQFIPDASALGSGGKVTLQFDAVAAGRTALKLIYHRAFETGVAPLKTFELTLTVDK